MAGTGFTYSQLKTAIQNYVDSSETTFVDTLTTIIQARGRKDIKRSLARQFQKERNWDSFFRDSLSRNAR